MKIDLNKKLVDPSGAEISSLNMAKELANGLAQQANSKNPLKVWEWCQRLHTEGGLDLDTEDLNLLKEAIKSAQGFTVMFTGQVLQEIARQEK